MKEKLPPVMRVDVDLATSRGPDGSAIAPHVSAFDKSPAELMREMGFDPCTGDMTPLEFLVAVMNDRADKVYRNERKRKLYQERGIALTYRVSAAKAAARYMHMEMPKLTYVEAEQAGYSGTLAEKVSQGQARVTRKTVILEQVEMMAPDHPVSPAQYPESIQKHFIDGRAVPVETSQDDNTEYGHPE